MCWGNLTTHNFVFEAWTGMGLVGLAVYCVFLLAILLTPGAWTGRERFDASGWKCIHAANSDPPPVLSTGPS